MNSNFMKFVRQLKEEQKGLDYYSEEETKLFLKDCSAKLYLIECSVDLFGSSNQSLNTNSPS